MTEFRLHLTMKFVFGNTATDRKIVARVSIYISVPQQERILNNSTLDFLSSETSRRVSVVKYNFFIQPQKAIYNRRIFDLH